MFRLASFGVRTQRNVTDVSEFRPKAFSGLGNAADATMICREANRTFPVLLAVAAARACAYRARYCRTSIYEAFGASCSERPSTNIGERRSTARDTPLFLLPLSALITLMLPAI
jgi:hypothetical protein